MDQEKVVWGIHAGKTGDAEHLFLKEGYVALGWADVGDVARLKADREAFKAAMAEAYPSMKAGAIPTSAGQLFRFIHEIKEGDIVAYPSKRTRHIHLGEVRGEYVYDRSLEESYPNRRPVQWLRAYPRTHFTQGALYEIGSALSFFQIKTYADEFRTALEQEPAAPPVQQDESVPLVAEEIQEMTRDFILKQLAQELKGYAFQDFVAHVLETMGYRTRVLPEGPDAGVDIIAHKDELGVEPPIVKVQVKSTVGSVGDPVVSALYGKVAGTEFGLLMTLGTFTNQAESFARSKSNLRLIDGEQLVDLILQHYEQLDSRYKALLPLKRVYVPEGLQDVTD